LAVYNKRPQLGSCPVRTFSGQGGKGEWMPVLFGAKILDFSKFMECPHVLRFCADFLYGQWTASNVNFKTLARHFRRKSKILIVHSTVIASNFMIRLDYTLV